MKANAKNIINNYMKAKSENATLGMYTVSASLLGNHSTKIIIGSATPINLNSAREFIFAATDNKLVPYNETFKTYEDKHGFYASMIAYRSAIQHKTEEAVKGFTQISANSYLDTDLNQVWTKENIDGKNFYIRQNDDQLEEIMQNALYITSSSNVALSVNPNTFEETIEADDFVEFFTLDVDGNPGKSLGQISDISNEGDMVTVKVQDQEVAIPASAILNKINIQAASSKAEVMEYLKKAYPDAYSEILNKIK